MAALMVLSRPVLAGPVGGTVVDGAATISQAGTATNINQSTNKAIINWQGFSVGANESVNFYQPGASSVTLNRVIGNETSVINGAINANGQVFIVNSAGVLFGKGSQVNVGGLVASTQDISNKDFMAGNYTFSGTSNAAVINQGRIRAHGGGYVALLGKTVSNDGVISARLGTVAMSAGEKLTLNFEGNSLLDVTIDKGALNALVENKRAIIADGGRVILTARAADQVLAAQVNNTGIVQARTVAALKGGSTAIGRKGRRTTPKADPKPEIDPAGVPMAQGSIKIYTYGGIANIAGKLDASAPKGGDGGFIETSGDQVKIADSAVITTLAANGKTGTWLIDPNDFTIAVSGGNMTGAAVVNALLSNNFEIKTATMGTPGGNGDIFVNDTITWSSNNTLTLNAERNVNINQAITAKGASAKLVLNAGNNININNVVKLEGASATLAMNYGGYNGTSVLTPIAGTDYNIRTSASYAGAVLGDDGKPIANTDTSGGVYGKITFTACVDAASCANTSLTINNQNYKLIGSADHLATISGVADRYALAHDIDATSWSASHTGSASIVSTLNGTFTGLGHVVSNLTINAPTIAPAGLIGLAMAGSTIRDIGVVGVNITARGSLGALLGQAQNATTVSNAYSTGSVQATAINASTGLIATALGANVGGLIGIFQGGSVTFAYSDVNILVGFGTSGGLIGQTQNGAVITNVHATGDVTLHPTSGGTGSGGLIGTANSNTTVNYAYASGDVFGGGNYHGGLIGSIIGGGISNSFALGHLGGGTSNQYTGGLLGYQSSGSTVITNVYSRGDVSGNFNVGGLIGGNNGTLAVDKAHAEGQVTGSTDVGGFIGSAGAGSTISNAYATGAVVVTVAGNGGGFAGSNAGSIDSSYSTGSVTGIYNDPMVSSTVGGFVGLNTEVGTITNSHSTGDVTGTRVVGGFVGNNGGLISGSWTSSTVTGTQTWFTQPVFGTNDTMISDPGGIGGFAGKTGSASRIIDSYANTTVNGVGAVGAMVGSGSVGSRVENSFWNTEKNPGTDPVGRTMFSDGTLNPQRVEVIGGGGLNNAQIGDVAYYLNGTINQVLTDRAFRADGARTGSTAATGGDVASSGVAPPATAASMSAMRQSAKLDIIDDGLKQVEQNIKAQDRQHDRDRQRRVSSRRGNGSGSGSGPSYRGTIRSIDVDGQRFEIERDSTPNNSGSNNSGAPASSGGAQ